jgi:hypothetical protein
VAVCDPPLAVLKSVDLGASQDTVDPLPINRSFHVLEIDGAGQVQSDDGYEVLDGSICGFAARPLFHLVRVSRRSGGQVQIGLRSS